MTADDGSVNVLYVSADLFLGSRVRGALDSRGGHLQVAGSGELALEAIPDCAQCRVVFVDLETPGLQIDALVRARGDGGPPIVAYGPHVHEHRLQLAREAGCDEVLTRGQFDASLPKLLDRFLPDSAR